METQYLNQTNFKQENNFHLLESKNNYSSKLLSIIFQLSLWFFMIYTLFHPDVFPILGIIYFIYLINEFNSNTCKFIFNKKSTNSIYNKLKEIFSIAPCIKLSCECFHYEKHLEERRTEKGEIVKEEVERKHTTYNTSEYFPYYSFRDTSGLFKIDLDSEIFRNKNYIQLHLDTIISFADAISYSDYQIYKNNFISVNRGRDQNIDFKEQFFIPNLSKVNLIKIKDTEPFYVNGFFFFLCVILTMGVPYELLLDNISIVGKFQIKKSISTRYNLNSVEFENMYGNSIPSIKLGENEFNFIPEDYGHFNENMDINLPTLEEIENAKVYESQVKYPVFDDGQEPAPINYEENPVDLPTEEEIKNFKKKNQ